MRNYFSTFLCDCDVLLGFYAQQYDIMTCLSIYVPVCASVTLKCQHGFVCLYLSNLQVAAEDESGIIIWDLRMQKIPILELPGHTHWYSTNADDLLTYCINYLSIYQICWPFFVYSYQIYGRCIFNGLVRIMYMLFCNLIEVAFLGVTGRTWAVRCNPEYEGLILVLSLSLLSSSCIIVHHMRA